MYDLCLVPSSSNSSKHSLNRINMRFFIWHIHPVPAFAVPYPYFRLLSPITKLHFRVHRGCKRSMEGQEQAAFRTRSRLWWAAYDNSSPTFLKKSDEFQFYISDTFFFENSAFCTLSAITLHTSECTPVRRDLRKAGSTQYFRIALSFVVL